MMWRIVEQIEIDANRDLVWRLFIDPESWPSWNRSCRAAAFDQGTDCQVGSRIKMTMGFGPVPLTAVVSVVGVETSTTIVWSGGRLGVRSTHRWSLAATANGGTLVTSDETFSGWTLPFLRVAGMGRIVGHLTSSWLLGLKAKAESLAGGPRVDDAGGLPLR